MDQEKIGKFIKKIREENHLTQKEFADQLGVTFQAVSKWENGKNVPDISILKQISDEFHVNIDEILEGERREETPKKKWQLPLLILLIVVIATAIGLIIHSTHDDDYQFKTISSKCEDFKITGSAAYNKEKATIYISNVEFCGPEDNTIYSEISCDLYEYYQGTKTKISSCDEKKNTSLEDYLKELNMKVDHYSSSCKEMTSNTLTLEINAVDKSYKTITYSIPIKLNDTCK